MVGDAIKSKSKITHILLKTEIFATSFIFLVLYGFFLLVAGTRSVPLNPSNVNINILT